MVDSKENCKYDLEVEGLNVTDIPFFGFLHRNNTLWANTTGDQLQVIVSGLQPFTFYSIKVCCSPLYLL